MKTLSGKVVSTKMEKTAVVEVERWLAHPVYKKRVRNTKKYHAHNEAGAKTGDRVSMTETRPISRTKKFKITQIL